MATTRLVEPRDLARARTKNSPERLVGRGLLYLLAVIGSCLFMGPFFFTITSSLKSVPEVHAFPPTLFPAVPQWHNYVDIFRIPGVPYALFYRNTAIITCLVLLGTVATAAASAYGLSLIHIS